MSKKLEQIKDDICDEFFKIERGFFLLMLRGQGSIGGFDNLSKKLFLLRNQLRNEDGFDDFMDKFTKYVTKSCIGVEIPTLENDVLNKLKDFRQHICAKLQVLESDLNWAVFDKIKPNYLGKYGTANDAPEDDSKNETVKDSHQETLCLEVAEVTENFTTKSETEPVEDDDRKEKSVDAKNDVKKVSIDESKLASNLQVSQLYKIFHAPNSDQAEEFFDCYREKESSDDEVDGLKAEKFDIVRWNLLASATLMKALNFLFILSVLWPFLNFSLKTGPEANEHCHAALKEVTIVDVHENPDIVKIDAKVIMSAEYDDAKDLVDDEISLNKAVAVYPHEKIREPDFLESTLVGVRKIQLFKEGMVFSADSLSTDRDWKQKLPTPPWCVRNSMSAEGFSLVDEICQTKRKIAGTHNLICAELVEVKISNPILVRVQATSPDDDHVYLHHLPTADLLSDYVDLQPWPPPLALSSLLRSMISSTSLPKSYLMIPSSYLPIACLLGFKLHLSMLLWIKMADSVDASTLTHQSCQIGARFSR